MLALVGRRRHVYQASSLKACAQWTCISAHLVAAWWMPTQSMAGRVQVVFTSLSAWKDCRGLANMHGITLGVMVAKAGTVSLGPTYKTPCQAAPHKTLAKPL